MKRLFLILLSMLAGIAAASAQPSEGRPARSGERAFAPDMSVDNIEVSINSMNPDKRRRITEIVEQMQSRGGATRGVATDILKAAGFSGISTTIDIVTNEIIRLARIRKVQKQRWMKMIENECNYTDSLSSVKGLRDFYSETSRYGALDPSNINFDGISLRGVRNGHEILYIACHIDTTRLDHLFQHSKFYLVLDTMAFNPYECHLPNLSANNIKLAKASASERDNSFSFDERTDLNVGMELTMLSSWINEAVMVQQDVQLGTFRLNVRIPDTVQVYTYSRERIERNREKMRGNRDLQLDTTYVQIEGDCFVVPRSYMPVSGGERMWGTGEYKINVKFRESCRFSQDATRNEKLKHWHKDYRRLRKMQREGSEFTEYFRTLWSQNGDVLTKTMLKQGITTGMSAAGVGAGSEAEKKMKAAARP